MHSHPHLNSPAITGEHPAAMQHNSGGLEKGNLCISNLCCMLIVVVLFTCCLQRLITNVQFTAIATATRTPTETNGGITSITSTSNNDDIYDRTKNRNNNNSSSFGEGRCCTSMTVDSDGGEMESEARPRTTTSPAMTEFPLLQRSLTATGTMFVARIVEVTTEDISQSPFNELRRPPTTLVVGAGDIPSTELLLAADDATIPNHEPQCQILLRRSKEKDSLWSSEPTTRLMVAAEYYTQHKLNVFGCGDQPSVLQCSR